MNEELLGQIKALREQGLPLCEIERQLLPNASGNGSTVSRWLRASGNASMSRRLPSTKTLVKSHPDYIAYCSMKTRCSNPRSKSFKYYGGRGLTVCQRWADSFLAFVEDMGPRPAGMTLERKNNNGNYEPDNCKWATSSEQRKNQRPASGAAREKMSAGQKRRWHPNIADGRAMFTEDDIREIRRAYAAGASQRELAGRYGTTHTNIGFIVRRETWAHVEDELEGYGHGV